MSGNGLSQRFKASKIQTMVLTLAVAVSVLGFSGFQGQTEFVTFTPSTVLILQMATLIVGLGLGLRRSFSSLELIWPYIALAIFAFASILWAGDDFSSFKRASLVFVPGVMLSLLAASVTDPLKSLHHVTWIMCIIVVLSVLWSGLVIFFGSQQAPIAGVLRWMLGDYGVVFGQRGVAILNLSMVRPAGFTANPNTLALLASLAFLLLLSGKSKSDSVSKSRMALFTVLGIAIIWTFSRGSLLFMLSATGVFAGVVLARARLLSASLMCSFMIPVVLAGFVLLQSSGMIVMPNSEGLSFTAQYEVFSLSERGEIWAAVLSAFRDWAFWGVGFGLVQESLVEPAGYISAAHSVPFTMLGELGLVGFVLMLFVWGIPLRQLLSQASANIDVTAGLAAILVGLFAHQCFDSSVLRYHPFHFVFSYVLGLAMNPILYETENGSSSVSATT